MYVLVILFAVSYSAGNPSSGLSGPATVSIPGYPNKSACTQAGTNFKNQITDATLKAKTFTFCAIGP